jgi:glycosyltransferase involved in cell wall biosynthesis
LLLDVTRLVWRRWNGRRPTGIDRVCLAYLEHFGSRAQAVVQHPRYRRILDVESSRALFELLREPPKHFRTALIGGALRRLGGRSYEARNRIYLNIGHTGLDRDGLSQWVRETGVRPIYFVHDLIPLTHPLFCRAGEAERHARRMRTVLSTASGVIGNSQATLDELAHFAERENLPFPRTVAAWLGATLVKRAPPRPTQRPTFVVLGTIEARKNHLLLLRIWSQLIERLGNQTPRLLIIGQRGWEADEVFRILDHDRSLHGHVVELSHCSDEDTAQHLASARALLFPSEAEGYGLPLVEALALGTPVIATDLQAFREIGQGIPLLLSPGNEAAWERAILDYSQPTSAARAEQLHRLRAFRTPTWAGHFRIVEEWLASIDSGPGDPGSIRSAS